MEFTNLRELFSRIRFFGQNIRYHSKKHIYLSTISIVLIIILAFTVIFIRQRIEIKRKENMIKGAKSFLQTNDLYGRCDVRFDVITIIGGEGNIEHYEDAFRIQE